VAGTVYYGIYKGPIWNGQMTSRLVYGYKDTSLNGNVTYTPEFKSGLKRFEVWNESFPFGDGVAAWVNWLPKDFVGKHFAPAPPVIRDDRLVEKYLRQVIRKEADIDHILSTGDPDDIEDFFEQRWGDQCERCPFLDLCSLRALPQDLIDSGRLQPRHKGPRDEAEERAKTE
jgi:hypothetical protein